MNYKPIIFNPDMVQAIRAGNKIQTRRIAKSEKPPYSEGGRLWVRERFALERRFDHLPPRDVRQSTVWYSDGFTSDIPLSEPGKTRPSIFMPRWASRFTLIVEDVRQERLQSISRIDCTKEGIPLCPLCSGDASASDCTCKIEFRALWDSINAKSGYGWGTNPNVWVVEFSVYYTMKI